MRFIQSIATGVTNSNERNDCVVRALANVSGKEYSTMHSLLKKHGRKDRKGTYWGTTIDVFRELGWESVYFGNHRASKAFGGDNREKGITLGKLVKDLPRGKFVVYIRGHALALVEGKIIDMFDNNKNSRVIAVYYDPVNVFKSEQS